MSPHEKRDIKRKVITELNRMTIGLTGKLNELIEKNYDSQQKFAEAMNRKESQISKWLSGHHNFTLETIAEIAVTLNEQLLFTTFDFNDFETKYSIPKPDFLSIITQNLFQTVSPYAFDFVSSDFVTFDTKFNPIIGEPLWHEESSFKISLVIPNESSEPEQEETTYKLAS